MKVRWVVIYQYYRPCLAPLCSDVTLYISHHMTVLEAKNGASICGSLFEILCAPLMFVFVFQEAWGEGDEGGGDAKV